MKTQKRALFCGILAALLQSPMFISDGFAADMMRKDQQQIEYLRQPGVDLPANLEQELDPALKKACLEKDEQHMRDGDPDKYACMEDYQNTPQIDIGDFNTPPDGEHPIFQDRMGDDR